MSDARDKVAEARARTMQLAASRLARKQELAAELARRKGEKAELATLGESSDVVALARDVDARIQALSAELAFVDADLQGALREMDDLKKLGGEAQIAQARELVRSVTDPDPILRSPEEQALDNVRAHIADLDARLRLGAELSAEPAPEPPSEPAPPPAGTPPKKTL
jgi:hypothetical protein